MHDYKIEDYRSPLFYRIKYISGIHTGDTTRPDYHNSLNLIFIFFIKGHGKIKIDGVYYEINEGNIIALNPSEFFLFNVDNNCFHERIVLFTNMRMVNSFPCDCSTIFSRLYKRKKGVGNKIPSNVVKENNIDRLFYELLEIARDKNETSAPLSICKIVEILCAINKVIDKTPTKSTDYVSRNPMINNVLDYINENYTNHITIQDIAEHVHIHRSYLSHKFKEQMGVSLWNYVVLKRIYRFNSLVTDNSNIEDLAYSVGFDNYSNFFRLYKKYMGISPMEFKNQFKKIVTGDTYHKTKI